MRSWIGLPEHETTDNLIRLAERRPGSRAASYNPALYSPASSRAASSDVPRVTPSGHSFGTDAGHPPPRNDQGDLSGETNQNPTGVGLWSLVQEDFETHGRSLGEPGFWALAVHRFGNWRMDIKPGVLRKPLSAAYQTMYTGVNWLWGIDLRYSTKVGRRVRLWHHGGMVLSARAIGDDVHIRHNTTLGVAHRNAPMDAKPVIGDRVDIGVGAVVLGPIEIHDDSVVGANAVVVRSYPVGSKLVGVPARPLPDSGTSRPRRISG
jgi:serine O-acetyltransferase